MAVRLNPNESRAIGTMEGNSFERQPFPLLNFEDRSDPRSFCLPSKILISFLFQNIDHDALLRHSKTNNDQQIEYFLFVELFGGRRKCPYLKQKKKTKRRYFGVLLKPGADHVGVGFSLMQKTYTKTHTSSNRKDHARVRDGILGSLRKHIVRSTVI